MNNPAVDLLPACFRFSNMNMCSVFSFFHARFQRSDLVFWLYNSSLNIVFPQNVSTSSSGFEWHGQLFFQAQPRIAAYILHNVSRQSRAHNHRLLSALLNGPIDRAGLRLVSVLRDQNYLAVSPAEQVAALADFRSSPAAVAVPLVPSVVVTEDMQIALADDILARSARLALISEDADPALHAMAKNSLQVRLQRYSQWSTDLLAGPHLATPQSRSAGHSRSEPRSPPGLPPRMGAARHRIVGMATAGVPPRIMGIGPAPASQKVLALTGLTLAQMDVIELNEAFAAQGLAVLRQLGLQDDDPRVNPYGGAIALGHPLGASGARLITTAMYQLQRTQGRYALCTMCIGVGQGIALIIERV
jgi:hypothetical protein